MSEALAFDVPELAARATGMDGGVVRFGTENQVYVRFYRGTKRDNFASQQAGHPVDRAVDMVEIRQFGEKDSTISEVNDEHRMRWPNSWLRYQQGREQIPDGTPLDMLFPRNPEVVSTLKANHIHTIEALAALPDTVTFQFAGEFKKKAGQFIEGINKGQKFHQLESELETEKLKRMELEDRLKALEAAAAKSKPKE